MFCSPAGLSYFASILKVLTSLPVFFTSEVDNNRNTPRSRTEGAEMALKNPLLLHISLAFASGITKGCMSLCFLANQASMPCPKSVHPTIPILSESSHHSSFVTASLPYARILP